MTSESKMQNQTLWRLRPRERIALLILGDLFASAFALFIALYYWSLQDDWATFSLDFLINRPPTWYYLLPFLWLLLLFELYDNRRSTKKAETAIGIAIAAFISLLIYLVIYFTTDPASPLPRIAIAIFIPLTSLLTLFWRLIYIQIFTAPRFLRRVLIVGAGLAGSTIVSILKKQKPAPFILVGLIDDDPNKIGKSIDDALVLGGNQDIQEIIEQEAITDIISAISGDISSDMMQSLINAEEAGIEITTMPILYEELLGRVPIKLLHHDWLLRTFFDQVHSSDSFALFKRLIDVIGGLFFFTGFLITFPFIALLIVIDTGFPIFLVQERLGKNGKPYKIIKFRTMRAEPIQKQVKMTTANDERITPIGKILRKLHLDELPQSINVLKGEMSIVGPRPEITSLVNHFQEEIPFYRARLLVKPGLTGWAQIHQNYAANVDETVTKLEYDLYYIKHRTLLLDFYIMLRTVGQVIGFRGR